MAENKYFGIAKWWSQQSAVVKLSFMLFGCVGLSLFLLHLLYGNMVANNASLKVEKEQQAERYEARIKSLEIEKIKADERVFNCQTEKNIFIKEQFDRLYREKQENDRYKKEIEKLIDKLQSK